MMIQMSLLINLQISINSSAEKKKELILREETVSPKFEYSWLTQGFVHDVCVLQRVLI